nr:aminopeptidase [Cytophagales bacterium]
MPDLKLLQDILAIPSVSGSESHFSGFLVDYVLQRRSKWKVTPELFFGEALQDNIVLAFGVPRTAIFAHLDTVGFMARYENQLVPIGGPEVQEGDVLVGEDAFGPIRCTAKIIEDALFHDFKRGIIPGTILTYEQQVCISDEFIEAAYLDNRLGVYNALKQCETLENGLVIFSTYEEHGGGSIPLILKFCENKWDIKQALISDITWVTEGVSHHNGVVISIRDRNIPRRSFVDRLLALAEKSGIPYQIEVEAIGSSDGREVQLSPYPIDWCFIGAPEDGVHSALERVSMKDLEAMVLMYEYLLKVL